MPILRYPNPSLRKKLPDVVEFGADLASQVELTLVELSKSPDGVALAANQVGIASRFFVTRSGRAYVNPSFATLELTVNTAREGCLSFPGVMVDAARFSKILLRAFNIDGKPFEEALSDFDARMAQHEIDHLDGKLFIDRLSRKDKFRLVEKFTKRGF